MAWLACETDRLLSGGGDTCQLLAEAASPRFHRSRSSGSLPKTLPTNAGQSGVSAPTRPVNAPTTPATRPVAKGHRKQDLQVDADADGVGGDDVADTLRYAVASKSRTVTQRKLR